MTDVINADMQRTPSLDMFERIEAALSAQAEEHAAEMIRERNANAREVSALANVHDASAPSNLASAQRHLARMPDFLGGIGTV